MWTSLDMNLAAIVPGTGMFSTKGDDGKPQPLGPYTRAVVATRDEPAHDSGGLALTKGAQIYLIMRQLPWARCLHT